MKSEMAAGAFHKSPFDFLPPNASFGAWLFANRTINPPYQADENLRGIEMAINRYVIPVICVIGFLGNVMNLVVLTRKRFSQSDAVSETGAHVGLVALSVSDMLLCVVMFPKCFIRSTRSLFPVPSFDLYYQAYGTGVVTTFILISTWITVSMATLRYLGICHPLRSRNFVGLGFAKALYLGVTLTCVCGNLPSFWLFRITDLHLPGENHTFYLIDIGHMDTNLARGLAFQWLKVVLGVFVPAIVLIFCNCSLIAALRRSYRMRKQCYVKGTASKARNRVTLTLVAIVTTFVCLVFPSELMDFFSECVRLDTVKTEVFLLVRSITNCLQVINFACNFFLYCTVNLSFRNTFQNLLECQGCKRCLECREVRYIHRRMHSTTSKTATTNF